MTRAAFIGLILAVGAPLAVPAQAGTPPGTPLVTAQKPWIRYLLPNIPAAAYMTLRNTGSADAVLTGAASPDCGALMLHKSEDKSGMAMMMAVPKITIPAGGEVALAPGGYHLMCMQPKMKRGEHVPVSLKFADGSIVLLVLPVYGPAGPS
jgi:copper(I)-binding protein